MTIQELNTKKETLLKEANRLSKLKKDLYSNIDIESPVSNDEKSINKKIADLFSEINMIVIEKRKLKVA